VFVLGSEFGRELELASVWSVQNQQVEGYFLLCLCARVVEPFYLASSRLRM